MKKIYLFILVATLTTSNTYPSLDLSAYFDSEDKIKTDIFKTDKYNLVEILPIEIKKNHEKIIALINKIKNLENNIIDLAPIELNDRYKKLRELRKPLIVKKANDLSSNEKKELESLDKQMHAIYTKIKENDTDQQSEIRKHIDKLVNELEALYSYQDKAHKIQAYLVRDLIMNP